VANSQFNNVVCGDNYTDAATIRDVFGSGGGVFEITNEPVVYSLQFGGQGADNWTEEATIGTGGGTIPPGCTGVRFRNATAGLPATVSALIRHIAQPHLSLSFANPVIVVPANVVNLQKNGVLIGTEPTLDFVDAGANAWTMSDDVANTRVLVAPPKILTGRVSSAGAVATGTGFTITKGGIGVYTVNFTTPFASVPTVLFLSVEQIAMPVTNPAASVNSVGVVWYTDKLGNIIDTGFEFFAFPIS
jgi:hypothetical protein